MRARSDSSDGAPQVADTPFAGDVALAHAAGDQRIVSLLGLVEAIARDVHRRLGRRFELADLRAEGYVALVEASGRFDPSRGAELATFAYRRIEGAMLDYVRKKQRWFNETRYLAGNYAEVVTEVLDATDSDERTWNPGERGSARWAAQAVGRASILAMARLATTALPEDSSGVDRELLDLLREKMDELPEKDRHVLRRLWSDEWTLAQIGAELGVSKEYARRLHLRAVDRLRRLMACAEDVEPEGQTRGGWLAEEGT